MSALPVPKPLFVEGGRRWIGHVVLKRDFPPEYRASVSEAWEAMMDLNRDNVTLLPDELTDRFLSQHEGRSPRFNQKGLFALELGAKAINALVALERGLEAAEDELATIASKPDATDDDRDRVVELTARRAKLAAELATMRDARRDLKDELGKVNERLEVLESKPDATDDDRDRVVELTAEKDRLIGELINDDSVIFRHSGPGYRGRRHIEIIGRLAGAKAKPPRKGNAEAPDKGKASKVAPGTNGVISRDATPDQIAAAAAANAAVKQPAESSGRTEEEEKAEFERHREEISRAATLARQKKARRLPRIDLEAPARLPGVPAPSIGAILEEKGKAMGITIVPESPDDS